MSTAIRSCVVNMFHLYKKSFSQKMFNNFPRWYYLIYECANLAILFKTPLVNLNEETYLLYTDNKYKIRPLMLVTKFNVKLNQLFILLMRKEFYSDQIYLTGNDSSKSCLFIGP